MANRDEIINEIIDEIIQLERRNVFDNRDDLAIRKKEAIKIIDKILADKKEDVLS